ncbi:hypothetical protein QWY82_01795 [Simiduia curdlanivorans]|uniref:Thymidylate kinase n=1 Tax=Simiduia curdlanivorans TaxID=1492769 RepID=A0ABV8V187_9GAMM|nr:hypothetical protein [Simiduia curdlanivorans]MDN3637530.1 hypothetical protein [Simiduia curdlanivorans]
MQHKPWILAVDGHDGTGKTTLTRRLAQALDAEYVRPYGDPYGPALLEAAEAKNFTAVMGIADQAYRQVLAQYGESPILVFDRLWITLFTLLPEADHHLWPHRPATAICWIDLHTTLERLAQRDEQTYPNSWHKRYVDRYLELGKKYDCTIINTQENDEEQALALLVAWAKDVMAR